MIDRHNYHLFQPLLYQVATAALSPGEIAQPIRSVLRPLPQRGGAPGRGHRHRPRRAAGAAGAASVPYDYLILSPGSSHSYFGKDEWAPRRPGLKWVDDALEIRRRILLAYEQAERERGPQVRRALLTFVVVGAGPTGVELAGAMAEIARQTLSTTSAPSTRRSPGSLLLEAGPRVLPTFPEELSASAVEQLQRWAWRCVPGPWSRPSPPPRYASARDGEAIETRTALWSAGVQASSLLRTLGLPLDRNGRVTVEPDMTLPGHPEAYVIGDARSLHAPGGQAPPWRGPGGDSGGAPGGEEHRAHHQGPPPAPLPLPQPGQHGHHRAPGGDGRPGLAALQRVPGLGAVAGGAHLLAMGFDNRVLVFIRWAWSYFTYQRGARLITGPVEVSLLPARVGVSPSKSRRRRRGAVRLSHHPSQAGCARRLQERLGDLQLAKLKGVLDPHHPGPQQGRPARSRAPRRRWRPRPWAGAWAGAPAAPDARGEPVDVVARRSSLRGAQGQHVRQPDPGPVAVRLRGRVQHHHDAGVRAGEPGAPRIIVRPMMLVSIPSR